VDCVSNSNAADGIYVETGSTVRGCTARANNGAGIYANYGYCYIIGNNSEANNDTGIVAQGYANRVDGNVSNSNRAGGFAIFGAVGTMVIRNSAADNQSWIPPPPGKTGDYSFDIWACVGPIVDTRGYREISSTSPWANFIH
jgi:hypothetical protein